MTSEYGLFASDFYINMRLSLKMDLPMRRDTVLAMFDRVKREVPGLDRFKRYSDELALESSTEATIPPSGNSFGAGRSSFPGSELPDWNPAAQQWIAVRKTSIRSGAVNPSSTKAGYDLHRLVLDVAPFFLDISALDIDNLELLWGFDLPCIGNHDAVVFDAIMGNSPLTHLFESTRRRSIIECQPTLGLSLGNVDGADTKAFFEVKTRSGSKAGRAGELTRDEPISVYLMLRRSAPVHDVKELVPALASIVRAGEDLLDSVVLPKLLMPIRDSIAGGGGVGGVGGTGLGFT